MCDLKKSKIDGLFNLKIFEALTETNNLKVLDNEVVKGLIDLVWNNNIK